MRLIILFYAKRRHFWEWRWRRSRGHEAGDTRGRRAGKPELGSIFDRSSLSNDSPRLDLITPRYGGLYKPSLHSFNPNQLLSSVLQRFAAASAALGPTTRHSLSMMSTLKIVFFFGENSASEFARENYVLLVQNIFFVRVRIL